MKIVRREPVPIYSIKCVECKSEIEYKAVEVAWCHISCPVCGVLLWASTICPVRYEYTEPDEQEPPKGEDDAE